MCLNVLNVCPDCQTQILADVPGKPSWFKTEVVTVYLSWQKDHALMKEIAKGPAKRDPRVQTIMRVK